MSRNKQIFTQKFKTPIPTTLVVKEKSAKDSYLTIWDVFVISYHHESSCCENVYVDFEDIPNYIEQANNLGDIEKITISVVKKDGIVIFLYPTEWDRLWIFLPCRNEQSGYYDDNLTIDIHYEKTITTLDLKSFDAVQNCY